MKKCRLDCVGVADVFFNSCDIQPDIISMHCCCQDSEERNINISMCTSRGTTWSHSREIWIQCRRRSPVHSCESCSAVHESKKTLPGCEISWNLLVLLQCEARSIKNNRRLTSILSPPLTWMGIKQFNVRLFLDIPTFCRGLWGLKKNMYPVLYSFNTSFKM